MHDHWLNRAIEIAVDNVRSGIGGPFGAVITRNGELVAEGGNLVTSTNDPTAHAEVTAIRNACKIVGNIDLAGCIIYASCEPCPMCLGAIYWAHVDAVWFAATRHDAAAAAFSDELIYRALGEQPMDGRILFRHKPVSGYLDPFREWERKADKIRY